MTAYLQLVTMLLLETLVLGITNNRTTNTVTPCLHSPTLGTPQEQSCNMIMCIGVCHGCWTPLSLCLYPLTINRSLLMCTRGHCRQQYKVPQLPLPDPRSNCWSTTSIILRQDVYNRPLVHCTTPIKVASTVLECTKCPNLPSLHCKGTVTHCRPVYTTLLTYKDNKEPISDYASSLTLSLVCWEPAHCLPGQPWAAPGIWMARCEIKII